MTDAEAVSDAFDALDGACESVDPPTLVELFVPDDDATFWGSAISEAAVGPERLAVVAAALAAAPGSFRIMWTERRVTVVGDTGWVNAEGIAQWDRGDGRSHELPYRATVVFVRRDGRWLCHTHNGSEPSAD